MENLDLNYISQAVSLIASSDFVFTDEDEIFLALNYNHQNVVGKQVAFAVRGESASYFLNIAEQMNLEVIYRRDIAKALFDEFNHGKMINYSYFCYLTDLFYKNWDRRNLMREEELFLNETTRRVATKIAEAKFAFYNDVFFLLEDELQEVPDNTVPMNADKLCEVFEKEVDGLKTKYNLSVNKTSDYRGYLRLDLGIDIDEDISKFVSITFDAGKCRIRLTWMPVYSGFYFYEYKKVLTLLDFYFGCDVSPLKMQINIIRKKYQLNIKSVEIAKNTVQLLTKQILGARKTAYYFEFEATSGRLITLGTDKTVYEIGFSYPEINSNPAAFINLLKDIKVQPGEELYCAERVREFDWTKAFYN